MYEQDNIQWHEHLAWFRGMLSSEKDFYWTIVVDSKKVGVVCINDFNAKHKRASWAFYLAESDARGGGIGAVVEFFIADIAFGQLHLNRLECEVLDWNKSVKRLHEKFGFVHEGCKRQNIEHNGTYVDVDCFAMLRYEWEEKRQSNLCLLQKIGFLIHE